MLKSGKPKKINLGEMCGKTHLRKKLKKTEDGPGKVSNPGKEMLGVEKIPQGFRVTTLEGKSFGYQIHQRPADQNNDWLKCVH